MRLTTALAATGLLAGMGPAAAARAAGVHSAGPQPVATYSIVARDPATGRLGVAVQSHWFCVGALVPWAEAGVGAVATQSFVRVDYGPELLADLRAGRAPEEALAARTKADEGRAVRQVGLVDAKGRAASFTGKDCIASAGGRVGEGWAVQANIMADDSVVPAMAAAWEKASGDFPLRLLAALDAAQAAGGDLRGRQSAAMLIVEGKRQAEPWQGVLLDVRVDDHPEPLAELRRLVAVHAAYDAANAGDARLAAGDAAGALALYERAEELMPGNVELTFWRGIGLVQADRRDEGLAVLRRVFARERRWLELVPRLVAAGHLADDAELLAAIRAQAPPGR